MDTRVSTETAAALAEFQRLAPAGTFSQIGETVSVDFSDIADARALFDALDVLSGFVSGKDASADELWTRNPHVDPISVLAVE